MSKNRFILLDADASRPSRTPPPSSPSLLVKADAADTEGRFTLLESRGAHPVPSSVHEECDVFVHVLEGELGVDRDGVTHRIAPGMCALLPRGARHRVHGLSAAPVRALYLVAPGAREEFLRASASGEASTRLGGVAEGPGDPDRFIVLDRGQARPGRVAVPPAFCVKARTEDTEGRFSLLEVVVAQDIPRHVHHEADEAIYVLEGELAVEYDGRVHTAAEGQFVLLPHGVPHALRPGSTPPPRVLQISAPGGWERFVEATIEARARVGVGGRLDAAALNRVAAPYGITYEE
ncbi:cupin domain-containing protein [Streptomyces sp. NPDC053474]|uniref:cupin domain-containing protein n=1 Tax=Streptomyces sp. NPDC053474 TaxID=3365704 RepID=UPI0037CF1F51